MQKLGYSLALSLLFTTVACTVERAPTGGNPGGNTPKDAGTAKDSGLAADGAVNADGSMNNMGADAAVMDGMVPPGDCNPTTGTGCDGTKICVYNSQQAKAFWCRDPAMAPIAAGMTCSSALQDCEAGFSCLSINMVTNGSQCMKMCRRNTDSDCSGLMDPMGNPYRCIVPLSDQYNQYGVCTAAPTDCSPLTAMSCGMGQHCDLLGAALGCIPDGPQAAGQPCTAQMLCGSGLMCIDFGQGHKCYEPCNHMNPMSCTGMNSQCGGEVGTGPNMGLGFGVCEQYRTCNPIHVEHECNMGENCEVLGGVAQCAPEGPNTTGMACGQNGLCQRGSACLNFGMGAQCYQVCDPMNAMGACPMPLRCGGLMGVTGWGVCAM